MEKTDKKEKTFGLINMRAQPFHLGHQAIINEIMLDGHIPVIYLGSSQDDRDLDKNPMSFGERKRLIRLIYPNVDVVFVKGEDSKDWDEWYRNLYSSVKDKINYEYDEKVLRLEDDVVVYYNEKEVDRKAKFSCLGYDYANTWYTDIFQTQGFEMREVRFISRDDIKIDSNARDIRHDIEAFKHLLDFRIYQALKEKGWK